MTITFDNAFSSNYEAEEFDGLEVIPYAQFQNPQSCPADWGLGIKKTIAESINFLPNDQWIETSAKFKDPENQAIIYEQMYTSKAPRLLILHRSKSLYMQPKGKGRPVVYNETIYQKDYANWQPFSYCVLLPLDENGMPLCDQPLRLKLRKTVGIDFKNQFINFQNDYCKLVQEKIHPYLPTWALEPQYAIFEPIFTEGLASSKYTGESSESCRVLSHTKIYFEVQKDKKGETVFNSNALDMVLTENHPCLPLAKIHRENSVDWVSLKTDEELIERSKAQSSEAQNSQMIDANYSVTDFVKESEKIEQQSKDHQPAF